MKIVAFGEVMMRLMTESHKRLTQTNTLKFLFAGTGMNVLSGLYQLGEEVFLATTLPNNVVGSAASAQIRRLGISDRKINYDGNHIGVYILEPGTGNRATNVTYLNRKESSFGLAKIDAYDIDAILEGSDMLHLCGISLALNEETRETAIAFAKRAKTLEIPVFFDCNFRATLWDHPEDAKATYETMLNLADIVSASEKDAKYILGLTSQETDEDLARISLLSQMQAAFNIATIIGTIRSENKENNKKYLQGYMLDKDDYLISEPYELTIYDRVGGGDAFVAGMIHALAQKNFTKVEQLTFGTVSGVLGHTTYGDSPITTKEEIFDFIENGPSDIKR